MDIAFTDRSRYQTQSQPAVLDTTPRYRWRLRLPENASLKTVVRFLNALELHFHGVSIGGPLAEFATEKPKRIDPATGSVPSTTKGG